MKKISFVLALISLSSTAAYAGGTVAPAPAEAPAAPAPAPYVAPAPAPAPVVVAPVFVPSWYVGASVGQSKVKDFGTPADWAKAISGGTGATVTSSRVDDKDTAWKIFAGYRFHPNFALELTYIDLGKATADASGTVFYNGATRAATLNTSFKSQALGLDAVGILPFANQFDVFGKVGGYYARTTLDVNGNVSGYGPFSGSRSDNNTDLHFGVGASYHFTNNVGVRVEWERYKNVAKDFAGTNNDGSDVDVSSIGVTYKF